MPRIGQNDCRDIYARSACGSGGVAREEQGSEAGRSSGARMSSCWRWRRDVASTRAAGVSSTRGERVRTATGRVPRRRRTPQRCWPRRGAAQEPPTGQGRGPFKGTPARRVARAGGADSGPLALDHDAEALTARVCLRPFPLAFEMTRKDVRGNEKGLAELLASPCRS